MSDDTKIILRHIDDKLDKAQKLTDAKFDQAQKLTDAKFDKLEKKIDEIDKKADDRLAVALEHMDDKFSLFLENVDTLVDNKLKPIIRDIDELKSDMKVVKAVLTSTTDQVDNHENRITVLEQQPA